MKIQGSLLKKIKNDDTAEHLTKHRESLVQLKPALFFLYYNSLPPPPVPQHDTWDFKAHRILVELKLHMLSFSLGITS